MDKYYRHFKGGLYKFIGLAKDNESLEEMVVYQALYGEGQIWVRPAGMFFGKVERDGKVMDRFMEVGIVDVSRPPQGCWSNRSAVCDRPSSGSLQSAMQGRDESWTSSSRPVSWGR